MDKMTPGANEDEIFRLVPPHLNNKFRAKFKLACDMNDIHEDALM